MQCACAILSYVACLALQYFSILSHKRHDRKKKLLDMKCVFWFSLHLSETFLILSRLEQDMFKNLYFLHVKYPLFFPDVNGT